jgi:hypothetical protein
MTPQQKALIAELRAADYPATWTLRASAADDKLMASGTHIQTSASAPSDTRRRFESAGATA